MKLLGFSNIIAPLSLIPELAKPIPSSPKAASTQFLEEKKPLWTAPVLESSPQSDSLREVSTVPRIIHLLGWESHSGLSKTQAFTEVLTHLGAETPPTLKTQISLSLQSNLLQELELYHVFLDHEISRWQGLENYQRPITRYSQSTGVPVAWDHDWMGPQEIAIREQKRKTELWQEKILEWDLSQDIDDWQDPMMEALTALFDFQKDQLGRVLENEIAKLDQIPSTSHAAVLTQLRQELRDLLDSETQDQSLQRAKYVDLFRRIQEVWLIRSLKVSDAQLEKVAAEIHRSDRSGVFWGMLSNAASARFGASSYYLGQEDNTQEVQQLRRGYAEAIATFDQGQSDEALKQFLILQKSPLQSTIEKKLESAGIVNFTTSFSIALLAGYVGGLAGIGLSRVGQGLGLAEMGAASTSLELLGNGTGFALSSRALHGWVDEKPFWNPRYSNLKNAKDFTVDIALAIGMFSALGLVRIAILGEGSNLWTKALSQAIRNERPVLLEAFHLGAQYFSAELAALATYEFFEANYRLWYEQGLFQPGMVANQVFFSQEAWYHRAAMLGGFKLAHLSPIGVPIKMYVAEKSYAAGRGLRDFLGRGGPGDGGAGVAWSTASAGEIPRTEGKSLAEKLNLLTQAGKGIFSGYLPVEIERNNALVLEIFLEVFDTPQKLIDFYYYVDRSNPNPYALKSKIIYNPATDRLQIQNDFITTELSLKDFAKHLLTSILGQKKIEFMRDPQGNPLVYIFNSEGFYSVPEPLRRYFEDYYLEQQQAQAPVAKEPRSAAPAPLEYSPLTRELQGLADQGVSEYSLEIFFEWIQEKTSLMESDFLDLFEFADLLTEYEDISHSLEISLGNASSKFRLLKADARWLKFQEHISKFTDYWAEELSVGIDVLDPEGFTRTVKIVEDGPTGSIQISFSPFDATHPNVIAEVAQVFNSPQKLLDLFRMLHPDTEARYDLETQKFLLPEERGLDHSAFTLNLSHELLGDYRITFTELKFSHRRILTAVQTESGEIIYLQSLLAQAYWRSTFGSFVEADFYEKVHEAVDRLLEPYGTWLRNRRVAELPRSELIALKKDLHQLGIMLRAFRRVYAKYVSEVGYELPEDPHPYTVKKLEQLAFNLHDKFKVYLATSLKQRFDLAVNALLEVEVNLSLTLKKAPIEFLPPRNANSYLFPPELLAWASSNLAMGHNTESFYLFLGLGIFALGAGIWRIRSMGSDKHSGNSSNPTESSHFSTLSSSLDRLKQSYRSSDETLKEKLLLKYLQNLDSRLEAGKISKSFEMFVQAFADYQNFTQWLEQIPNRDLRSHSLRDMDLKLKSIEIRLQALAFSFKDRLSQPTEVFDDQGKKKILVLEETPQRPGEYSLLFRDPPESH